ncbi:AsmA family protein [Taklimakanibacter lacteus]|uniref:AsmA family protein n=1 Tax=Taklimakanibacter lacteus TaxID=2268456 RepID=UPI0013C4B704
MKLWKSPVLYFGIALVMAVVAAFIAPYVIDWGSYRMAIEKYGRQLTGRPVTVAGDISGRLFPWPKLTIRDVKVANPPGAFVPDFITAEQVDVRMTLAGLLGGEIRVEGIDVVRPVASFERLASGQGSWHLKPELSERETGFLDRIRLDQISVTDGVVHLVDNRRAGRATIAGVNATLAAQNFAGPWRVRATADYHDRPVELSINTGSWTPDSPFKFGFRISSGDGSGIVYQFDGANDGNHVTGNLRVQPAASVDGRSDAEGQLRPLVLTAQVTSDFDTVALDKIEITPRDGTSEGANLLTGSAEVKLGTSVALKANLKATRFDLDAVAGAKAKGLIREGGGLGLLENAMAIMPGDVDVSASLGITSLVVGGEALDNAKLAFELNQDQIRITELSAGMPGQARGLFTGTFVVTDSGPQLAGDLAGEAGSLRDFVSWAWPEGRNDIARIWTGSRGRFKLQTRLDATDGQLRLQDMNYQIDESLGSGGLSIGFAERPTLDLRLDATALDIDRFAPNGFGSGSWIGTAEMISQWATSHDLRLTVQSGETLLNGVGARDVAIDIAAIGGNIDLKTIEIGNVGNAHLEIAGLLSPTPTGNKGAISTSVTADDPRSLLQLLGFYPKDSSPIWADALGKTDLIIAADLKPDEEGQAANFRVTGKSGDLDIEGTLATAGQGDLLASEMSGSFTLRSANGTGLAKLAGMSPVNDQSGPARLAVSLNGSLANGLVADLEADVFGAKGQFQGKFLGSNGAVTGTGRLGIFAERPNELLLAAGISDYAGGTLSAESDVEIALPKVILPNVQGFLAGAPLSGSITLDSGNRLKGEFATGPVSFTRLFGLAFMPWDGRPLDVELPFAVTPPRGVTGELWIKPEYLEVFDGLRVRETQIGISATPEEVRLAAFGKSDQGGDVAIEIAAKPQGGGKALDGRLVLPVDLGHSLKNGNGEGVAEGLVKLSVKAAGSGRTPGAVLASLAGSGSYDVAGLRIAHLNPERFVELVKTANSGEELKTAFTALAADGGLDFAPARGVLKVENGTVTLPDFAKVSPVADVTLAPKIDLPDGRLDAMMRVTLKTLDDQPQFAVTYSGHPNALTRFVDIAALESELGFKVVERTLKELERLQAEQQKAMDEEDRARREDEARLEAYNEQRRELQRRLREVNVHERMREAEAAQKKIELDQAVAEGRGLNREELLRRVRERQVHRVIRRQEEKARLAREEAERKAKEEADRQAQEEAERKAKEEAERQAQEEAARKAQEEAERQAKEEAARQAQEEAERKAKEEAAREAQEEAERKAREDAILKAQQEAERQAKEEAERLAQEEAERQAKEEAERKARAEAILKAQQEAERKAQEEAERKAQEDADRKALEDMARQAEQDAKAARADPAQASQPEPLAPQLPAIQPDNTIFGPQAPDQSGTDGAEPLSPPDQTEAIKAQPEQQDVGIITPPTPKPKPKRQPAKTQAKVDPGAPVVLVPPQKVAPPPRRREPDLIQRIKRLFD